MALYRREISLGVFFRAQNTERDENNIGNELIYSFRAECESFGRRGIGMAVFEMNFAL